MLWVPDSLSNGLWINVAHIVSIGASTEVPAFSRGKAVLAVECTKSTIMLTFLREEDAFKAAQLLADAMEATPTKEQKDAFPVPHLSQFLRR